MISPLDDEAFQDMLDRSWEKELAIYLGSLADDLSNNRITTEQAIIRLENIKQIRN